MPLDYSKLSDDELRSLAYGGAPKELAAPPSLAVKNGIDFGQMSDEQLRSLAAQQNGDAAQGLETPLQRVSSAILKPIVAAGKFIDSYTGAPVRSAIGALQNNQNPISAYANQFGANPELAPTGKDIATKAGISPEQKIKLGTLGTVSPAGVAGLAIDVLADPTLVLPLGKIAEGGGKILKGVGDLATGGLVSHGVTAAKSTFEASKNALSKLFNPGIAEDFNELTNIAVKNGIPAESLPSSIEFGKNSVITRSERARAEGPLGENLLNQHENAAISVRDAVDKKISDIAAGAVLNPQEAGTYIRTAYNDAAEKLFNNIDVTYNKIVDDYPGLKISDTKFANETKSPLDELNSALNGIEKFAKGRLKRGVEPIYKEQGAHLLQVVDAVRETNGSLKQLNEAMSDIGKSAFKARNSMELLPPDIAGLRDIYFQLSDAFSETVRRDVQDGAHVADALKANNALMSEFFGNKSLIAKSVGDPHLSPEGLFRNLIQNGDSIKINALKSILGEEAMQPIKGAWLDSLVKRDIDQSFGFKPIINSLRNKQNVAANLLNANEIKDFGDILRLGDRLGPPIMSHPGTGGSMAFRDIADTIKSDVGNSLIVNRLKDRARTGLTIPESSSPFITQSGVKKALKGSQIISIPPDQQNSFRRP